MASPEEMERILTGASVKEIPLHLLSVGTWLTLSKSRPSCAFLSRLPGQLVPRLQAVVLSLDAPLAVLSLTDREPWK